MNTDVVVRLATPEDAKDIAAMSRDGIEYGLPWTWRPGRVLRAIQDPDTNVAVVGDPGALVAFGIMSYADDDAELLLFAVRPSNQRKGFGSAVLQWLEAVARTAGVKRICVEARLENIAARSFYCEHGYYEHIIRKRMYDALVDGVRLEKRLRRED
jgi:[ribosomal protein S18]-alanine N-acetyltransferase